MNLEKIANRVGEIASQVGRYIKDQREVFATNQIEYKGKNNLVSYVDRTAEEMSVRALSSLIPQSTFLTEEGTVENVHGDIRWIIDPLDGTTNFIHNFPPFAVSIALEINRKIVVGVVYEITREETFMAWENGGAWCNKKKIFVASTPSLDRALISTGFPYFSFEKIQDYLKVLHHLMEKTHGLRRTGSAATDLAYVACGRFDGFFEFNLSPWDVAAGSLLVKEAGGYLSDFSGGDQYIFGKEIVAAGAVHKYVLEEIQKHW